MNHVSGHSHPVSRYKCVYFCITVYGANTFLAHGFFYAALPQVATGKNPYNTMFQRVKCIERKTWTANKINLEENASVHGEKKIKLHCPHTEKEITFRGLVVFWFQRSSSYMQRVFRLNAQPCIWGGSYNHLKRTTQHILTKLWRLTEAWKCRPTCVLSKESKTSWRQKKLWMFYYTSVCV